MDDVLKALGVDTHEKAQTKILGMLLNAVRKLARGQQFALDVVVNVAGSPQRQGGTDARGVVLCVHNPTAGAITLTLYDGSQNAAAPVLYNAQLAAGESWPVYLPFAKELVATSGSGCRLYGEYRVR